MGSRRDTVTVKYSDKNNRENALGRNVVKRKMGCENSKGPVKKGLIKWLLKYTSEIENAVEMKMYMYLWVTEKLKWYIWYRASERLRYQD